MNNKKTTKKEASEEAEQKEAQPTLKESLSFHDKENNLFNVDIEIKDGTLSISGQGGASSGQCQDSIKPLNDEQRLLLNIWDNWHLNDLHAGTERQELIIKQHENEAKYKKIDSHYDKSITILKAHKAYSDHGYRYGSAWLKRELPENLESRIRSICETIRRQEAIRKENLKLESFNGLEEPSDKIKALAMSLDLSLAEALKDITEDSETEYTYCGITYFVGTENEATERAKDYIDTDMWAEAVKAGNTTDGFEEWQDYVISIDGYGQILNSWDGSEDSQEINGTWYYIIRM